MSTVICNWSFSQFCDAFGEALINHNYMDVYPEFHEALGLYDIKYIILCILKREKDIQECFYLFVDTCLLNTTYIKELYGMILDISKFFMNRGAKYYDMSYETYEETFESYVFRERKLIHINDLLSQKELDDIYN